MRIKPGDRVIVRAINASQGQPGTVVEGPRWVTQPSFPHPMVTVRLDNGVQISVPKHQVEEKA